MAKLKAVRHVPTQTSPKLWKIVCRLRRFMRFRMYQLMLTITLCALLIALGRFAYHGYRDDQCRLAKIKSAHILLEYVQKTYPEEHEDSITRHRRLKKELAGYEKSAGWAEK